MTEPKPSLDEALSAWVDARRRPAIAVVTIRDPFSKEHVARARQELSSVEVPSIDVVVHSYGGNIHAMYQLVELVRSHAPKVCAVVPVAAKSAATLLCIGVNEIVMGDLAELGPLDAQIQEKQPGGSGNYGSALNPFKTLEQIQTFALETLDMAMKLMLRRSGMNVDECLKHAIHLVSVLSASMLERLEPQKLGAYGRALAVGEEYGKKLLSRYANIDDRKAREVMTRLVRGYPSHEFIIDRKECEGLGLPARGPEGNEVEAMNRLTAALLEVAEDGVVLAKCGKSEEACHGVS